MFYEPTLLGWEGSTLYMPGVSDSQGGYWWGQWQWQGWVTLRFCFRSPTDGLCLS